MKVRIITTLVLGMFLGTTISVIGCNNPTQKDTKVLATKAITKPQKRYIKVALLLDTSNSMDGLINQAKAQLWDIVNELSYARCDDKAPNLQIALYEYGNDRLSSREGYIRQVLGFSEDLDEISEKLFSLTTNGGSEFCGQVIQTSLNQLEWGNNPDDLKLIFIAGNEPFTQGRVHYKDATTDAKEKDVVVNTIFCGNFQQGIQTQWKAGAVLTGGDYMSIDHNQELVHITTPYDDIIIQLNTQLNGTYVPYGSYGARKIQAQAEQDSNAQELEEVVMVKRAVSKSSSMYKNASWDLVDAAKDSKFKYSKLKDNDLPKELKGKSEAEIKKYVTKKANERATIQKKIQELNKKRAVYVAEKQKDKAKNVLDAALIQAIKKQANKKNYIWQ